MSTRVNRYNSQFTVKYSPLSVYDAAVNLLYPLGGGIKRRCASDVCLTCHVHPDGRLGWCVLAHRARPGRPGSRLPLRASVAAAVPLLRTWGGAYCGGLPHSLLQSTGTCCMAIQSRPFMLLQYAQCQNPQTLKHIILIFHHSIAPEF